MKKTAYNIHICTIGADEYRTSTFVILFSFSNSPVRKKVTVKGTTRTQNSQPLQSPERWL
jgi:RNA 3'-terminal phosphate cyclase